MVNVAAYLWVDRRFIIAMILASALISRCVAAIVLPDQTGLLVDAIGYRKEAAQLLHSLQIQNPFVMPLYPALVALTGPGSGQLIADIVLSTVTAWLVYALAFELFGDEWIAALAGMVTAFYPPLIFFSVVGLSETLFILLIYSTFLCWYRGAFIGAAILAVLAILTRPIFDFVAVLLVGYFAIVIHRLSFGAVSKQILIYASIYFALMSPWWIHNYVAYGNFVRLNLGLGTVLYAGNNPMNHSGGGLLVKIMTQASSTGSRILSRATGHYAMRPSNS